LLQLDWWYDTRKIESTTVQGFADAFTNAVMELTREAIIEDETDAGSDELTLVDLSSNDTA
jgi:phthiocerol/phenolphthiocerol synthesis type-I polyketide synthase E